MIMRMAGVNGEKEREMKSNVTLCSSAGAVVYPAPTSNAILDIFRVFVFVIVGYISTT